jgi:hypothetical protein
VRRYDPTGFTPSTLQWKSSVTGSTPASIPASVSLATDAPGAAGNTLPISYLSGVSTSKIVFPEVYSSLVQMSICTVTRYTSTLNRARIFQPFKANINWLHGHWSGYSGVAYYDGWLTTSMSTTATLWVSTCSSYNTGTDYYTLDVNGDAYTSSLANMVVPDQLTINGNLYTDAEWSNFGVAEFIVWGRAISETELRGAQTYLTQKYGLVLKAPPAPPVPAAPQPPQPPLASSLANGMVAWCVRARSHACDIASLRMRSLRIRSLWGLHADARSRRRRCAGTP